MTIRIYNTISGKKENFEPVVPGKVGMYVCGPTVYDSCHIGHARSVVVFDVIMRYLKVSGYDATYVRNFTDVDDKIINRAKELGLEPKEVAEKYIREFREDMAALNVAPVSAEPRATEHIDNIVRVIQTLLDKGVAYQIDGDVFFSVSSFPSYGKLSGRRLEDMEAGSRIEIDTRKQSPFDFALWKSAKPGEPAWESPWGAGRPGWHIECSAMSSSLLGETIDIHGGGKDLIFPHHENEIAQSEAAFGKPFVKYWIHNGFININQEKMSKSLGNFMMIKEAIKNYHPEAIRLFLLSNHYRSPIDFTQQAMNEASGALDKMYSALKRFQERFSETSSPAGGEFWKEFRLAMDDDFNTAQGIGILFNALRNLNRQLDTMGEDTPPNTAPSSVEEIYHDMLSMGDILGILNQSPERYFEEKIKSSLQKTSLDPKTIREMIDQRTRARENKNWAEADKIRDELDKNGIILEDKPDGTVWKFNQ